MIAGFRDLSWVKERVSCIKFSWTWLHIILAIIVPGYLIFAAIGVILNHFRWFNTSRLQNWLALRF